MKNRNSVSAFRKHENNFNNFFCQLAPRVKQKCSFHIKHCLNIYNPLAKSHFSSHLVNMKKFKINNLKLINLNIESNKSAGPKSISIKILRLQNNDISKHLFKIYNTLFTAGIFPDKLKVAKVILVLEKDSQLEFFNYRPTSF